MPRSVSLQYLQASLAQQTEEVALALLTLDHPDMAAPLRFVNDAVEVTSNGNLFAPQPFHPILPTDAPDEEPRASIEISAIDLVVITALRGLSGRPTCLVQIVLASQPDVIEWGQTFHVRSIDITASTATLDIGMRQLEQEPFPNLTFDPVRFPAQF